MTRYCCDRPMAASSLWVRATSRRWPVVPVLLWIKAGYAGCRRRFDRRLVLGALFFQPGQRPEVQRHRPCPLPRVPPARQLQQANGVTGWRVSNTICSEWPCQRGIGQQGSRNSSNAVISVEKGA